MYFATNFVRLSYVIVEEVGISVTTATTEESCPTFTALWLIQHVRLTEVFAQVLRIINTAEYAAKLVLAASNELVARI